MGERENFIRLNSVQIREMQPLVKTENDAPLLTSAKREAWLY